jgi:hypothetical protein
MCKGPLSHVEIVNGKFEAIYSRIGALVPLRVSIYGNFRRSLRIALFLGQRG